MSQKLRKRDRVKTAIKSGGQKIATFTKSRIVRKFAPLFGLIAIITPGKAIAFTLDDGILQFGANATFIAVEYKGMREVVRTGVSAIPDSSVRTVVSTVGSIAVLVGGVGCGLGSAIYSGMGWEKKAMACLHGLGVCSGIALGMHDNNPINLITVPGGVVGDVIDKMSA